MLIVLGVSFIFFISNVYNFENKLKISDFTISHNDKLISFQISVNDKLPRDSTEMLLMEPVIGYGYVLTDNLHDRSNDSGVLLNIHVDYEDSITWHNEIIDIESVDEKRFCFRSFDTIGRTILENYAIKSIISMNEIDISADEIDSIYAIRIQRDSSCLSGLVGDIFDRKEI